MRDVRIKLTLFYSLLFLIIFWSLSVGLIWAMNRSLGQGYITEVRHQHNNVESDPFEHHISVVTIAGSIALGNLRTALLILNGLLLVIIPFGAWFLTSKTLAPMQKSFEQQKQFVSDASHELRTPLSIVSGEMEVVLKKGRTTKEYQHVIKSSKEEIDRLASLVGNLLYLARGDHGKNRASFRPVDLTDLLCSVLANFLPKIKEKHLKLHFNPPVASLTVNGQVTMLRTLFVNLVDNAIKYTPKKGVLEIRVFSSGQEAVVEIEDTGIGIDAKNKEKIFNRFYRVEASRSETKGFGLGLAIAKSIIEWHKGKIWVKSVPGQGTIFIISLPIDRFKQHSS